MILNHNYDRHARGSGHPDVSVNAKLPNLDSCVRGNDGLNVLNDLNGG
jgi:hypothetical protein